MSSAVLHSECVQRVREALARAGLAPDIVELPGAARTAQAAAGFLGCHVAQIANSLVFQTRDSARALLVMSSGAKRVDLLKLSALVSEPVVKVDAGFVRQTTGFAIGGVPPLGHCTRLSAFVDTSLASQPAVWAAAGHPHTVFRLTFEELLRITDGRAAEIAE